MLCEFGLERFFLVGYILLVAFMVDEGGKTDLFQPRVFRFEIELVALRA